MLSQSHAIETLIEQSFTQSHWHPKFNDNNNSMLSHLFQYQSLSPSKPNIVIAKLPTIYRNRSTLREKQISREREKESFASSLVQIKFYDRKTMGKIRNICEERSSISESPRAANLLRRAIGNEGQGQLISCEVRENSLNEFKGLKRGGWSIKMKEARKNMERRNESTREVEGRISGERIIFKSRNIYPLA